MNEPYTHTIGVFIHGYPSSTRQNGAWNRGGFTRTCSGDKGWAEGWVGMVEFAQLVVRNPIFPLGVPDEHDPGSRFS